MTIASGPKVAGAARWLRAAPALLALALPIAGCGGSEAAPEAEGAPVQAAIQTFMFEPDPLEVDAGATVEWTNGDEILHTVTAGRRGEPTSGFDHELDGAGTTATVTFKRSGTVRYFCSVHDGMDGTVIVR